MRILQGIVGVEAIVLVVLFALLAQRGDVAPPSLAHAAAAESSAGDATAAGGVMSARPATQAAPDSDRVRVDGMAAGADGAIVLQGRLVGLEPPPPDNTVRRLQCLRDDVWRPSTVRDGAYAIPGLGPGVWTVRCEVEGCVLQEFEHTLTDAPVQRLDITLQPAVVLPVFVRTTTGTRLQTELTKLGVWQSLHVIATEAPLTGDLQPTEHSSVGDVGLGRHRVSGDANQRADDSAGDGVLELDRPPPLHAALLLRHVVIAQQPILAGQRELRFEVDFASVRARMAKVRCTLRDANGQPIAGARASLSSAQGGGSQAKSAEDGAVEIDDVLPGLNHFDIWAKDQERYFDHLTLPAGATTDLGEIVLTTVRTVRGRLVDAAGEPVRGSVRHTAMDLWRPPHPLQDRRHTGADGDGNFDLRLGARRYTVRATIDNERIGYAVVDARGPVPEPLVITLAKPTKVQLDVTGDPLVTHAVVVRNPAGDLLDVQRIELRWRELSLSLPPGDYRIETYDGNGRLEKKRSLHVGAEPMRMEVP